MNTNRPLEYTEEQIKLREILIDYGSEEYGDSILDEICALFQHPLTPAE